MKKENRIKKSHEIASIVKLKNKVVNKNFVIYFQKKSVEKNRFAFSVSKKYGHAFERNKAKRISREIFRKYVNQNLSLDFVIVIKKELKDSTYIELEKEAEFLMKLIKKKNGGTNEKKKL